eukprot:4109933-Karenia_brevis.AAC.1
MARQSLQNWCDLSFAPTEDGGIISLPHLQNVPPVLWFYHHQQQAECATCVEVLPPPTTNA